MSASRFRLKQSLCSSAGNESACNARDLGSIPGEGKGYPLQYSGLENSMDCIVHGVAYSGLENPWTVHGVTKSRTQLRDFNTGSSVQGILGKNSGECCHGLFHRIFPTQGSNPHLFSLLHWQAGSLPLAPPGKPMRYVSRCL